jgi:hypothetical protein
VQHLLQTQAKALAQQSLNAGLQAAQHSTALLLEEAARMNAAAVRQGKFLDVATQPGNLPLARRLAASRDGRWLGPRLCATECRRLPVHTARLARCRRRSPGAACAMKAAVSGLQWVRPEWREVKGE